MSIKKSFTGSLIVALVTSAAIFAAPTPDAMRSVAATDFNSKLPASVTMTRDADNNIISFHVNGVNPQDADILLKRDPARLSTEYTVISGGCKEGGTCSFMLPSNVATPQIVEALSKELVNAGSVNLQITKQTTGRK